ncbi:hypothetical protein RI367_001768 [Sorochytrium milnesiophthora]
MDGLGDPTRHYAAFYYPNWAIYARKVFPKDIAHRHAETIVHAFWALRDTSGNGQYAIASIDTWADFEIGFSAEQSVKPPEELARPDTQKGIFGEYEYMKRLATSEGRRLDIALSVGGWTQSRNFSPALATEASRQSVIRSIIHTFKTYPFLSIIDFDWEYVSGDGKNYGDGGNQATPQDPENFIAFLTHLRLDLHKHGLGHVAIGYCINGNLQVLGSYDVAAVVRHVDVVHGMIGYDHAAFSWGHNPDGTVTARYHTNIYDDPPRTGPYSVQRAIEHLLKLGVPAHKLTIGVAGYSRGYSGTDGIGTPAAGESQDMSWENGVCDYKTLPRAGATEEYNPRAGACSSLDPVRRIVNTYDCVESVREKCNFVKRYGLRGVILWEVAGDRPFDDPRSLVRVIHQELLSTPRQS